MFIYTLTYTHHKSSTHTQCTHNSFSTHASLPHNLPHTGVKDVSGHAVRGVYGRLLHAQSCVRSSGSIPASVSPHGSRSLFLLSFTFFLFFSLFSLFPLFFSFSFFFTTARSVLCWQLWLNPSLRFMGLGLFFSFSSLFSFIYLFFSILLYLLLRAQSCVRSSGSIPASVSQVSALIAAWSPCA